MTCTNHVISLYFYCIISLIFFILKKMVSRNSNKTKGEQEVCKEETCGDETLVRCVRL